MPCIWKLWNCKSIIQNYLFKITYTKILYLRFEFFRYDEALEVLESIIKRDETNAAPRKRKVAIFKARGKTAEAIKELTEYLKV